MRIATYPWTGALLGLVLGTGSIVAQEMPPPQAGYPTPHVYEATPYYPEWQSAPYGHSPGAPSYSLYARVDALAWWTNGSKLPPLLTTGPSGGILGAQGTQILFGDERVDNEVRAGGRITAGWWFDCQQNCGIEGTFFAVQQRSTSYSAASDGDGNPILARPFFNVLDNQQDSLLVSFPGIVRGSADFRTTSDFFGGDLYLRKNVLRGCNYRVDLLGGYRFLHLDEGLDIYEVEINIDPESLAPLGTRFDLVDTFDTENNFHGGQIGAIAEFRRGCWTLELIGKVAFGVNQRTVNINGVTRVQVPGAGEFVRNGGFLALGTNIGSHDDTCFAVVPEASVNLKYQVTNNLLVSAGYTFIFWTDVVRPGEQIDLAINTSQVPPGTLTGPARPAFDFKDSNFWAQGLSLGLELRY